MRSASRLVAVLGAALAVLALALPAAAAPVTVNIGAALTLTGTNSPYGLSARRGLDMAAAEINAGAVRGVKMNVKTIDDLGTRPGASAAFGVFARDRVSLIVGPSLSTVALTVDHFAQGAGIPVVAVSNTLPGITEVGDFIFRASLTEEKLLPAVVKAVASSPRIQPKTAVILQGSDVYAADTAPVFATALAANGLTVTNTVVVPPFTTDFKAVAAQVKQADPDIVALTALPAESVPLLKELRAAGYKKRIIGSNALNTLDVVTGAGDAANGLIVGAAWSAASTTKRNTDWIAAFRKQYKRAPDQFAATAYATAYVIAQAAANGKTATPDGLRTQLAAITGPKYVPTLLGRFRFDPNRNGVSPVVVQEVVKGSFTLFEAD